MPERKSKTPPTPEEKLERKVRRLESTIMRLEVQLEHETKVHEKALEDVIRERNTYREFIVDQTPEPFPQLLRAFITDPRHEDRSCGTPGDDLVSLIVEAAGLLSTTNRLEYQRAVCPLCERTTELYGQGYKLPIGLERHLIGWGNVRECYVMGIARELVFAHLERVARSPGFRTVLDVTDPGPSPERVWLVESQSNLPEGQLSLWRIESEGGISSPYAQSLPVPRLTRWVYGTKSHAAYVRERWVRALRWHALKDGSRLWVNVGHSAPSVLALLAHPDEKPILPTWSPKTCRWAGPEPVLVDLSNGYAEHEWRAEHGEIPTQRRGPGRV